MFRFSLPTPVIQLVIFFLGILIVFADYELIRYVDATISGLPKIVLSYVTYIGEAWPWITFFSLILAFSCFVSKSYKKYYVRPALFSIMNMLSVGAMLNLVKFVCGRPRPKHFLVDGIQAFDPLQWKNPFALSFPSGHSQAIWSAAVCLSLFWPRYRVYFMVMAAIVALTRFLLIQHYMSDVIAGSLFGFLGSLWFYQKYAHAYFHGSQVPHNK